MLETYKWKWSRDIMVVNLQGVFFVVSMIVNTQEMPW
jgi:hypothetical protein